MESTIVSVETVVVENELKYNDEILLTYRIEYPEFKSSFYQMSLAVINKFYKAKASEFQKHCETELYNIAVEQYKGDIENKLPIRVFEALLTYKLTYSASCILSLYFDAYEYTGGAHGNTIRDSQTWNLQKCYMLKLPQLFSCRIENKSYVLYILKNVEKQIMKEPDIYFEDYAKLIAETFRESSFYCTPEGIVIYFQQYEIAPYSSGIREFLIPYTDCVTDPKKLCFAI